jgi:hypothetical protein
MNIEFSWLKAVEGEGFAPTKAWPADLQSAPVGYLGNPPKLGQENLTDLSPHYTNLFGVWTGTEVIGAVFLSVELIDGLRLVVCLVELQELLGDVEKPEERNSYEDHHSKIIETHL